MNSIAVIIVSWNVRELLQRCLATVHASLLNSGIIYQIVVVDNDSHDGTAAMLRAEHPDVRLLAAGRNLGFAGGNNLALRTLLAEPNPPEAFLLLNPDTEVVGAAIPTLVRYAAEHPEVAVVGPRLRYPDGSVQSSRRRFPRRSVYFFESTPLENWWPNNPIARYYRMADRPDDHEQAVGWLVGAALLVRRSAIERAGLLDAGFQLYSEELEWQRRIVGYGLKQRPANAKVMFVPEAEIIHHEGKSSEQAVARRYITFQQSRLREAQMVYGWRFARVLQFFLLWAYGVDMLIEIAKWLVGHKRPLRRQRVRVYRQVVHGLAISQ
jgi:GT2 family glycosyltransferase